MMWRTPETGLEWGLMIVPRIWGWLGHDLLTRPYTHSFMNYLMIGSYAGGLFPLSVTSLFDLAARLGFAGSRPAITHRSRPSVGPGGMALFTRFVGRI